MMNRIHAYIPIAGLASVGVFLLPHTSLGIVCLSFLPLFLLGLHFGIAAMAGSALIATITACMISDAFDGVFFAAFIALPALVFAHMVLRHRDDDPRAWYPVLTALCDLTFLGALLFTAADVGMKHSGAGGLRGWMSGMLALEMKNVGANAAHSMDVLNGQWSFVFFALVAWLWILLVYGVAVLANGILASRGGAIRQSLAFAPGRLPGGLLVLLILSGLLTVLPAGPDRFECEAVLLILLLPYFLSGMATLHEVSRRWQARPIWLALAYASLVTLVWPALAAIAAGVYTQLSEMLDRRGEMS